jgi:hypothetical protein
VIAEFEQRLADVLGARLPAPFGGRVRVVPGNVPAAEPAVTLGVVRAERLADDLGGAPPVVAPGAPLPRRVVALRCTVDLEVRAATGQARAQQLQGVDATLHALDAPDLRRGAGLGGGAPDPGFLIHSMAIGDALLPLRPGAGAGEGGPVRVELVADGIFWPVGMVGETGATIGEVRLRGATLPIAVELAARPTAGGAPVDVTVTVGTTGLDLRAGQPPAALPFDRLAMILRGPGGQAGAGTLQGGTAGADGVRLALLAAGQAKVKYAPPAGAAHDELIVALDDGGGGVGVELGHLGVEVRS